MLQGIFLTGRGFPRVCAVMAAGLLAWAVTGVAEAAPPRSQKAAAAKRESREAERRQPQGALVAVVDLARQRLALYDGEGLLAQSAVSTGQPGHPTPTGVFSVIQKRRFHRSNIYSGAPMPFMQRLTWSGIALHAGVIPGYPASHGCIRLPERFAVELWGMTRMGARVIIAPEEAPVSEITSPWLPAPRFAPADARIETASIDAAGVASLALAGQADGAAKAGAGATLLNPLEQARLLRARTAADARAKQRAEKAAVERSAAQAAEANKAIAAVRMAEVEAIAARTRLDAALRSLDGAKSARLAERAKAAVAVAEARLAEATRGAEAARAREAEVTPAALTAAREAWDAETASRLAAEAAKEAERGVEPISVFISRSAGRLYIRQKWEPVHEVAVTFVRPDDPIGTHSYVATNASADGRGLRWLAVTVPASRRAEVADAAARSPKAKADRVEEPVGGRMPETAEGALERIGMPEETRQFIAERLWIGASLIVSDAGIGQETGTYTDFIILTR